MERLSEARDDEQRVVDAHAYPDHRDEDRRDRVEVGEVREQVQQAERRSDRQAREQDRHAGRDDRAEHDQQHDQRDADAEQLARALLGRRLLGVTRELGVDAGRCQRRLHLVFELDDLGAVEDEAVLRELHLGVADVRLGLREPLVVVGERARDLGRELLGAGARERARDGRAPLRRVELAALGIEDDLQDRAVALAELGGEEVRRLLGVRARDRELVLERAVQRTERQEIDDDENEQATEHRSLGVRGLRGGDAGKPARRSTPLPVVGGRVVVSHAVPSCAAAAAAPLLVEPVVQRAGGRNPSGPAHVNAVHPSNPA